ncbi:MAG: hypothetical protein GW907_03615 [Betaproteobacteria bacterium]|nr:hypothetical protein [Betaproteobacteria bacterium]
MACRRADFSRPWRVETRPMLGTHVSCFNEKQRPQPTRMAFRRADFSLPWRVETRPTLGTHVSCFGVSLLKMDASWTRYHPKGEPD